MGAHGPVLQRCVSESRASRVYRLPTGNVYFRDCPPEAWFEVVQLCLGGLYVVWFRLGGSEDGVSGLCVVWFQLGGSEVGVQFWLGDSEDGVGQVGINWPVVNIGQLGIVSRLGIVGELVLLQTRVPRLDRSWLPNRLPGSDDR